jgi:hypothetical protein
VVVDGKILARPAKEVQGKAWVRLDNANVQNQTAALFGPISETMTNATDALELIGLVEHASAFEVLPVQDIDGQSYSAYKATLTRDDLIASMPADVRKRLGDGLFEASTIYTVYVDAEGRPRRFYSESTTNGVPSKQTTDFTEWGVSATFETPPANQVVSLTKPGNG